MDLDLDAGQQPRCPHCHTLMRTTRGTDVCPDCRFEQPHTETVRPITETAGLPGF